MSGARQVTDNSNRLHDWIVYVLRLIDRLPDESRRRFIKRNYQIGDAHYRTNPAGVTRLSRELVGLLNGELDSIPHQVA